MSVVVGIVVVVVAVVVVVVVNVVNDETGTVEIRQSNGVAMLASQVRAADGGC